MIVKISLQIKMEKKIPEHLYIDENDVVNKYAELYDQPCHPHTITMKQSTID